MEEQPEHDAIAEAYAHEDLRADAAQQTVGMAWVFAIVPVCLVLVVLQGVLGDWVWKALPVLFVAGAFGGPLLARLAVRWRSDLPRDLPGHGRIAGRRKRWLVLVAMALLAGGLVWETLWQPALVGALRDVLLGWRI